MKRFFGMMPTEEIEISKMFVDSWGLKITIDAGKNGWTIMYADSSSEFKDVVDTAENNFQEALKILKSHLSVTECEVGSFKEKCYGESCEEMFDEFSEEMDDTILDMETEKLRLSVVKLLPTEIDCMTACYKRINMLKKEYDKTSYELGFHQAYNWMLSEIYKLK